VFSLVWFCFLSVGGLLCLLFFYLCWVFVCGLWLVADLGGVGFLNDRCEGALEALGYVRRFIERLGVGGDVRCVLREVNHLIDLLLDGAVDDFKHRVERY